MLTQPTEQAENAGLNAHGSSSQPMMGESPHAQVEMTLRHVLHCPPGSLCGVKLLAAHSVKYNKAKGYCV